MSLARLEQYDKAERAYNDAIQIMPNAMLAWQGLGDLYEKNGSKFLELSKKLSVVYRKILSLPECDRSKTIDVTLKLADALGMLDQHVDGAKLALALPELTTEELVRMLGHVAELLQRLQDALVGRLKLRNLGGSDVQVFVPAPANSAVVARCPSHDPTRRAGQRCGKTWTRPGCCTGFISSFSTLHPTHPPK